MGEIIRNIVAAIDASSANASVSADLGPIVMEQLERRFAHRASRGELWERLNESTGHQDPTAWRWISAYLAGAPCTLAFSPQDETDAVKFDDGAELVPVLEKCPGFEFYVTNSTFTFLLCFNHHDFLVAAGEAREWLADRVAAMRV